MRKFDKDVYKKIFAFQISDNIEIDSSDLPARGNIYFLPNNFFMRDSTLNPDCITTIWHKTIRGEYPCFDTPKEEIKEIFVEGMPCLLSFEK